MLSARKRENKKARPNLLFLLRGEGRKIITTTGVAVVIQDSLGKGALLISCAEKIALSARASLKSPSVHPAEVLMFHFHQEY